MTEGRSWLAVLHDRVETAFLWLSYAALLAMTLLTTLDALLRYFFNAPLEGIGEMSDEFFMPAIVYFSVAHIFRTGGHVRITLISDMLPPKVQRVLWSFYDVLTAALFALITYGIARRTLEAYRMSEYSSSPLNYVIWPSFAVVAIGSALMVIRALQAAVHPAAQDTHSATVD